MKKLFLLIAALTACSTPVANTPVREHVNPGAIIVQRKCEMDRKCMTRVHEIRRTE